MYARDEFIAHSSLKPGSAQLKERVRILNPYVYVYARITATESFSVTNRFVPFFEEFSRRGRPALA